MASDYGATAADLLIQDMEMGPGREALFEKFIANAADEIDARIGVLYNLPLPNDLPPHVKAFLKIIQVRLASGRLILQQVTSREHDSTHAYGNHLIKAASADLASIVSGAYELTGAPYVEGQREDRSPVVIVADKTSPVTAFEQFAFNPTAWADEWTPGP